MKCCFYKEVILIRTETKIIKDIIKSKYPNIKFTIRYKSVNNYVDSSDRLIVKLCDERYVNDVIKLLKKHTGGIGIYKTGEMASVGGAFNAKIINANFTEHFEPEMMEFIEVGCS